MKALAQPTRSGKEIATLAGGCFWCLEAVYDQVQGVESVESGYVGGTVKDPTYEAVCGGHTGHAEAVRITFDPKAISYKELLEIFFVIHDPTTLDRQGNDVGTQYRSAIFYHSPEQRRIAEETIHNLEAGKVFHARIDRQVMPAEVFYLAENYHQEYFQRNAGQPYCQYMVAPKLAKFRCTFIEKMKLSSARSTALSASSACESVEPEQHDDLAASVIEAPHGAGVAQESLQQSAEYGVGRLHCET